MHPRRAPVVYLHAITAHVPLACLGIFRNHHRPCDVTSAILRPALQNWKVIERKVFRADHFLARAVAHRLRKKRPHLRQLRQHLHFFKKSLRRFHIQKRMHSLRHFVQRVNFQRHTHAPLAPQKVRHRRNLRPFRPLEQQRRPARLHHPVGYLRHLQDGIHLRRNLLQLAFFFQHPDKFPQIPISHFPSGVLPYSFLFFWALFFTLLFLPSFLTLSSRITSACFADAVRDLLFA